MWAGIIILTFNFVFRQIHRRAVGEDVRDGADPPVHQRGGDWMHRHGCDLWIPPAPSSYRNVYREDPNFPAQSPTEKQIHGWGAGGCEGKTWIPQRVRLKMPFGQWMKSKKMCVGGSYLSAVVICLEGITHKVSKRSSTEHRENAHIDTSPSAQTTSTSELISTFSVSAVNNNCDQIAGYESIDCLCFLVPRIVCRDETHASTCWIHALTWRTPSSGSSQLHPQKRRVKNLFLMMSE